MANRNDIVKIMQSWIGSVRGDATHKKIIDTYNSIKGVPRMNYTAASCAATTSAAYQEAGIANLFPCDCSCGQQIEKAKKMGIWQEDDAYIPSIADTIIYAWNDKYPASDNITGHDHTGAIEKVIGSTITVLEGNMGSAHKVGRRTIVINGKNIRGYITPRFGDKPVQAPAKLRVLRIGDNNDDVKLLHQKLYDLKYGVDKNSKNFTALTQSCVIHFQASHQLQVDGIVGPKTWAKLGVRV